LHTPCRCGHIEQLIKRKDAIRKYGIMNTKENYWVFGLFPSSGIPENTTFRKLDLFPSSGESGGGDTYSVGPLRKS
jgi:hypothetical protein